MQEYQVKVPMLFRSEGPRQSRPDRKVGIGSVIHESAEGAAQDPISESGLGREQRVPVQCGESPMEGMVVVQGGKGVIGE